MGARRSILNTIALMAILISLGGCFQSTPPDGQSIYDQDDDSNLETNLQINKNRLDMNRKIDVVASIEGFDEEGWRDHFEDGGYAAYKISVLRIVKPVEYKGKWLNVRLEESPDSDSIWRIEGLVIKFRIAEEIFEMAAGEKAFVGVSLIEIVEIEEQM